MKSKLGIEDVTAIGGIIGVTNMYQHAMDTLFSVDGDDNILDPNDALAYILKEYKDIENLTICPFEMLSELSIANRIVTFHYLFRKSIAAIGILMEMQDQVKAICEKHSYPYNVGCAYAEFAFATISMRHVQTILFPIGTMSVISTDWDTVVKRLAKELGMDLATSRKEVSSLVDSFETIPKDVGTEINNLVVNTAVRFDALSEKLLKLYTDMKDNISLAIYVVTDGYHILPGTFAVTSFKLIHKSDYHKHREYLKELFLLCEDVTIDRHLLESPNTKTQMLTTMHGFIGSMETVSKVVDVLFKSYKKNPDKETAKLVNLMSTQCTHYFGAGIKALSEAISGEHKSKDMGVFVNGDLSDTGYSEEEIQYFLGEYVKELNEGLSTDMTQLNFVKDAVSRLNVLKSQISEGMEELGIIQTG